MTDGERSVTDDANPPTALAYSHNMARVLSVDDDSVELAFDLDRQRWPWLALPARHPVLLEKYQYFASVTAMWARGATDPTKHSALTGCSFECPPSDVEPSHATRGTCRSVAGGGGYELQLYSAEGAPVATYRGTGFVFTDRDFKAWRASARARALAAGAAPPTQLAPPAAVGLGEDGVSFVSPLLDTGQRPRCLAVVTSERGFHPTHPFHTGSGDHVNVGHLIDCALQLSHLVLDAHRPLTCVGGAAEFMRFVELDVPFELSVSQHARDAELEVLSFDLAQLDKPCTRLTLRLQR